MTNERDESEFERTQLANTVRELKVENASLNAQIDTDRRYSADAVVDVTDDIQRKWDNWKKG